MATTNKGFFGLFNKSAADTVLSAENLPQVTSDDELPSEQSTPVRPPVIGNATSLIDATISKIAADVSRYKVSYRVVDESDPSKGYTDEGIDEDLKRILEFEPNTTQSMHAFIAKLTRELLTHDIAAIVMSSYSGELTNGQKYALRVGKIEKLNNEPIVNTTRTNGKTYSVEYYNDNKKALVTENIPVNSVVVLHNPKLGVSGLSRLFSRALNESVNELIQSINDKSASGKVGVLKVATRNKSTDALARRVKQLTSILQSSGVFAIGADENFTTVQTADQGQINGNNIKTLTALLYSIWGVSPEIIDGSASAEALNYYQVSTIQPFVEEIQAGFNRLLGYDLIQNGHIVKLTTDKLAEMPAQQLISAAMSLVNSEILAPDEIREMLGYDRRGGLSAQTFNRNNKVENSTAELDKKDGDGNG